MKLNGMTLRQIAEAEGVDFKSVKESLDQVNKKISINLDKTPPQNR